MDCLRLFWPSEPLVCVDASEVSAILRRSQMNSSFIGVQPVAINQQPQARLAQPAAPMDAPITGVGYLSRVQPDNVAYAIGWWLVRGWLELCGWRFKTKGIENIPRQGPIVFVANHSSNCDAPILVEALIQHTSLCRENPLPFLAKKELFNKLIIGMVLGSMHQIPVDRQTNNTGSIELMKEVLASGKPVGIFPEGTRTLDGQLHRFHTGFLLMAIDQWIKGYPTGQIPMVASAIIGLHGDAPEWANPRCCGRDVETQFLAPETIDGLVASFKQLSTAQLKTRFSQWQQEGEVEPLLTALLASNTPRALLEEKLEMIDDTHPEKKAAQKILLRWLAQDFAERLAEASEQRYVDSYTKKNTKKNRGVAPTKRE